MDKELFGEILDIIKFTYRPYFEMYPEPFMMFRSEHLDIIYYTQSERLEIEDRPIGVFTNPHTGEIYCNYNYVLTPIERDIILVLKTLLISKIYCTDFTESDKRLLKQVI